MIEQVPVATARERFAAGTTLLDVREAEEQAIARLEGAISIPLGQLQARLAELEPLRDAPILCLCHHGVRSQLAARMLTDAGFTAANVIGGLDAWAAIEPGLARY